MSQPTAQLHQEMDGEIRVLSDANARPLFQKMEYAPVKVGEAPVANAESPHFEEALAKPIQKTLGEGAQTLEIKLTPSHLGSVTVSLTQNQDGTLHVVLLTMTDKAARLLSEHTGGLMHLLRAGPHSSVQIEVQQSEQGQQQSQEDRQNQSQRDPREQERRQQEQQHGADNFLQQLRLGLLPLAAEAV
jgi:flagellar hook-length control protein FliK